MAMAKILVDNKKIYDQEWNQWHDMKFYGPASRWLRYLIFDVLRKHVNREETKSLLDFGSGEGTTTFYLAQHFPNSKIKGTDFSQTGIELSEKQYKRDNLEFIFDDKMIMLESSYDLISAFEVLEHVDEWKELVNKMAKSTKKYLLFSFPTGRMRPFEKNVGHVRNFRTNQVEDYLKTLGFRPVAIYYAGFPFYSPLYREVCNLTNSASNDFTKGSFGWKQKFVSQILYFLFRFLSTKKRNGDQFCGLFMKES
jgi:SAM-dependent methyltransferase